MRLRDPKKRGLLVPPQLYPATPGEPKLDTVDADTLIAVGAGVSVLVAAGDVVPADIADKPRRARDGGRKRRGK